MQVIAESPQKLAVASKTLKICSPPLFKGLEKLLHKEKTVCLSFRNQRTLKLHAMDIPELGEELAQQESQEDLNNSLSSKSPTTKSTGNEKIPKF